MKHPLNQDCQKKKKTFPFRLQHFNIKNKSTRVWHGHQCRLAILMKSFDPFYFLFFYFMFYKFNRGNKGISTMSVSSKILITKPTNLTTKLLIFLKENHFICYIDMSQILKPE